jgi:hypothetical protein
VHEFFAQRAVDRQDASLLIGPSPERYGSSLGTWIATVLQQNQLFLLGQQFDLKDLFTQRLDQLFLGDIELQFGIVRRFGLQGICLFQEMVEILRETHETFVSYGIDLTPLNHLLRSTIKADDPGSLDSEILNCCLSHLRQSVIRKWFLQSNPWRLVPPAPTGIHVFLKVKRYGIPPGLQTRTQFITADHIMALIAFAGDVAVYRLSTELQPLLSERIGVLMEIYRGFHGNIKRIANAPIGIGTHKMYERFEGAYHLLVVDEQVSHFFGMMRSIGNILATGMMIDMAFTLFRSPRQQIYAYLFQVDPQSLEPRSDEFFKSFDKLFESAPRQTPLPLKGRSRLWSFRSLSIHLSRRSPPTPVCFKKHQRQFSIFHRSLGSRAFG